MEQVQKRRGIAEEKWHPIKPDAIVDTYIELTSPAERKVRTPVERYNLQAPGSSLVGDNVIALFPTENLEVASPPSSHLLEDGQ